MAKRDLWFQIQDDVSYHRRMNKYEIIWTIIGVFFTPFWLLGLIVIWLALLFEKNVTISPIGNDAIKFVVDKNRWTDYRRQHNLPAYQQYGKHHVAPKDVDEINARRLYGQQPGDYAAELAKYKKLLDDGAITQEEFDEQKAKLLH